MPHNARGTDVTSNTAMLEQSAIRRRLSHDLRASMFNIEGFLDELKLVVNELEKLIAENGGELPQSFVDSALSMLQNDASDCLGCLDVATHQLQERIDLMTLSVEAPTE